MGAHNRRRLCRRRTSFRGLFGRAVKLELLERRQLLAGLFDVASTIITDSAASNATLAPWGASWAYLDDGSNQGTAWREAGFDDAAWSSGSAQLGYGDGDEATVVEFGNSNNKFATTYFRHDFTIADPTSLDALNLAVIRDDGVAVYLNGVELLRDGLASGAGFNDYATQTIGGAAESTPINSTIPLSSLPPGTLVAGGNVLAAEIHQANGTSSDISLDLELTASGSGLQMQLDFTGPVDSNSLDAGDLQIDGSLAATSFTVLDADSVIFDLPALSAGGHTADIADAAITDTSSNGVSAYHESFSIAAAPQYTVHHPPHLQLGDAPLTGFPGSSSDQVELLWQTLSAGSGTEDSFTAEYREVGSSTWSAATVAAPLPTGSTTRTMHSTVMAGLQYATSYEYRVLHYQGDVLQQSYQDVFTTRLAAGDTSAFSFAAYGDSAFINSIQNFRNVQNRIILDGPDFAVLLGDNVYDSGTFDESDARFDPSINPEATAWMAEKIDYVGFGNHDVGSGGGEASEWNYSVPIPVAGVNAPAEPPGSETPEHNYSFDYGNVHFVTFDTNSLSNATRLNAQLAWVEADLAASTAKWKLVFGHHPVAGVPDKPESPADNYYQQVVPRLRAAGVDLFLVGHSHTYSWTYPLLGEQSGQATFVQDNDRDYAKGAGLVQLVAGTGGKDLRTGTYSQFPFVASGFTTSTIPVAEFGYAKVDVTEQQLTISYIAADDGAVIDSFSITDAGDFTPPTAALSAPLDNGPDDLDAAPASLLTNTTQPGFQVSLNDIGDGIDDATVNSATVSLSRDGLPLNESSDYSFSYNAGSDVITLTSLASDFGNGRYQLDLNVGASQIADLASNPLASTTFDIEIDTSLLPPVTTSFRQGVGGYTGTVDTFLQQSAPNANNSASASLNVDNDDPAGTGQLVQSLIRFENLFGGGPGQIPPDATIIAATVNLQVTNPGNAISLHRMLQNWSDTDTWSLRGNGVQADDFEATSAADATTGGVGLGSLVIDVLPSLQAWQAAPGSNLGWVLRGTGTDGVDFDSSEGGAVPELIVEYLAGGPTLPVIALTATDDTAAEPGSDTATFTISRDSTTGPLDVLYSVSGTAANSVDYVNITGMATIPDGGSSTTVLITPVDDLDIEGSETVILTMSADAAYTIGVSDTSTVTINDNDFPPVPPTIGSLTVAPDPVIVGEAITLTAVTVQDSDGAVQEVRFYRDADGDGSLDAVLDTLLDTDVDGGDGWSAVVSTSGLTAGSYTYFAQATDNDALDSDAVSAGSTLVLPEVSITATDDTAAEPGSDTATFIISRDSTTGPLDVLYSVSGTAANSVDYVNITGMATIPDGGGSTTVLITPNDDTDIEGPETVELTLSADVAYTIGVSDTSTVTINDNDFPPVPPTIGSLTVAPDPVIVGEAVTLTALTVQDSDGTVQQVRFYRDANGNGSLDIGVDILLVTDIDGGDGWSAVVSTSGLTAGSYTYFAQAADDDALDGNVVSASSTVVLPEVSITATDDTAAEPGSDTATFTMSRDSTAGPLDVLYSVSGTAANGVDYVAITGTATIPDGSNSTTVVITPNDDTDIEGPETVELTLSADAAYTIGASATSTVTINDDEVAATIDVAASESSTYGSISGGTFLDTHASDDGYEQLTEELYNRNRRTRLEHQWTIDVGGGETVTLFAEAFHNSTAEEFELSYSTDGGSSWTAAFLITKSADDNQLQSIELPPATSGPVLVRVTDTDQTRGEADQDTIFFDHLFIRSESGGISLPTVTVAASDAEAAEAGNDPGEFTISRDTAAGDLTVTYSLGGSAESAVDYEAIPLSVVIPDGEISVSIVITPLDDGDSEGLEDVLLTLSPGAAYDVGGSSQAIVNIIDDDFVATFDYAVSETLNQGTVVGDLSDTFTNDGVYETITEESFGGKKRSRLEQQWTFDVTGGDVVTFYAEAFHDVAPDDFLFEYSLDGVNWTTMFTVTATSDSDTGQSYVFATPISGTVLVRILDTDRSRNDSSLDSVYIDELYFLSEPASALGETAVDQVFSDW